ncbi:ribonuclease T2 [Terriglobus aquaticus]|uniref:Ribonuclease T2 n=1 Tax=Terriglobus aquaticus TaxID=940139 RepID=A0ABW9KEX5_9BACT|nr:ribonuclease T2 [Terriglobus aquaticus]
MNRLATTSLLLAIPLFINGCQSSQRPQPAPVASNNQRPVNDRAYDDRYQSESHHRHHHGGQSVASNDDWSSYDRPETSDTPLEDAARSGVAQGGRSRSHHNRRALTAAPGQFDFYVLNLSWSPEFCSGHPSAAECAQHRAFTLHGLWPQNNDGTYPEDCSEAPGPASPSQYADIYPDASLLQHEWQTHGTCSGLSADQFFTLARRADQSVQIPSRLAHLTQTISLAPSQIITLFTQANSSFPANSLALTCGNNFLTAVEVCMDKNLKPEACSAVKSCGATQVRIPPPQ